MPPVAPMLAKSATVVPSSDDVEWSHEPKWDGFRALIFRDGEEVVISSRNGKGLGRYFPELIEAIRDELPPRVVLDGEIGVQKSIGGVRRLDWDSLSQRIHPAESRINMLAEQTPAMFIGFDALALGDRNLLDEPLSTRRAALLESVPGAGRCRVSRVTTDSAVAVEWFTQFEGAGLDGVVSKRLGGRYLPGKREMVKVKHKRTADCVIMGYRIHKSGKGIGSMLLGLYRDGELRMVGGSSAFSDAKRVELQVELEKLRVDPDRVAEGEPSRWKEKGSSQWIPIRPELVAEFAYDQMEGDRFRHTVKFDRWRPDREPESCGYEQLDVPLTYDLHDVLTDTGSAS